ncbi:hypothetical protein TNCV_835501 [Trichonephila clavipes]|nr:hypothetical protein TNCV_835501 [Trichonephila clavipes]
MSRVRVIQSMKTHRVKEGGGMRAKSVVCVSKSSRWHCVEMRREGYQLRCRRHLTVDQNSEWLDSPGWALAFSRILFWVSLLPASVLQFLVLKIRRSYSTTSIHRRFGLPFLRVPIG